MPDKYCKNCIFFELNEPDIYAQRLTGKTLGQIQAKYKCISPTGNHLEGTHQYFRDMKAWGCEESNLINDTQCTYIRNPIPNPWIPK